MPGMRAHKVWQITHTVEIERREQVSHDESRPTGEWATHEDTLHIVAPDNEAMVRAWYLENVYKWTGRNRQIIGLVSYPLTAFIQEHIY